MSSSPSQQQLVLRGSELVAFTGALKEMVRTNAVRASRQAQLNETNSQLHAMHFFLHYCNAERSLSLKKEYESVRASIDEGRNMLAQMGSVIASQDAALTTLGTSMAALDVRATEQGQRVTEIEDELATQKTALAEAMAEYEARLAAQEKEFRAQEAVLARLLSVRFKIDFGLDALMALMAWYAAHNGLVTIMAGYLGQNVIFRNADGRRTRNRYTRNWITVVQLMLFAVLLRRLRRLALENGLHHAIGSYTKYAQFVARMCGSTFEMVRGAGRAAVAIDEESQANLEGEAAAAAAAASAAHSTAASSEHAVASAAHSTADGSSALVGSAAPDYSSSAAASVGRTVGEAVLTGLRSGRDSLRWMLGKVVATSAPEVDDAAWGSSVSSRPPRPSSAAAPAPRPVSPLPPQFEPSAPLFVAHDLAFASSLVGGVSPQQQQPHPVHIAHAHSPDSTPQRAAASIQHRSPPVHAEGDAARPRQLAEQLGSVNQRLGGEANNAPHSTE